jgi:hypothetical protein
MDPMAISQFTALKRGRPGYEGVWLSMTGYCA